MIAWNSVENCYMKFLKGTIYMTDEQKKEICKAYFDGFAIVQIADFEGVSDEEVKEAIRWGRKTGYEAELEEKEKEKLC